MPYVITEEQYKRLLIEDIEEKSKNHIENAKEIVKKNIEEVGKQQKINFRFLLTYGAGISTFIEPVQKYLSGQYPNLNPSDISLLVLSAISIIFFETKDYLDAIKIISQRGLDEELKNAVTFTEKLKNRIVDILNVLGLSSYRIMDILSYSFILPILGTIKTQLNTGVEMSSEELLKILESLIIAAGITLTGSTLKKGLEIISKKLFEMLN
jgi:glucosamine 6-phosphate synthetase-like amidotransferase/phosphosugar isomerase protein